ncbi:MAG TPA: hypothetical protein VGQ06_06125 [Gemmatimonadales bacterium]|jgi:hypothetical protein|nr:hypothetical protein [Gemmatimonadales bacterium]
MGRLSPAALLVAGALAAGCRERAEAVQSEAELRDMVRRMMPLVAQAAHLRFKREPLVLRRSRDQVREYVIHKFDQDLPAGELAGLESALRLFGLIPDTLHLRPTMIELYTEQIAGYYDPDSNALYIPADIEPFQLRVVVSHELGHALQDQYVRLDSIITQHRRNDRRAAAQAILEGQATITQIPVLMPEQKPESLPLGWFWQQRAVMARQQAQMVEFARAPLWLREGLIFPYLGGADFIVWFQRTYPRRSVLDAIPTSTEQILHPERYAAGDEPTELTFAAPPPDTVQYEDGLGEFETRLLLQQQLGDEAEAAALATGWDGDRYQILGRGGAALVWYSVWDDARVADRFARGLDRAWQKRRAEGRTGRRSEVKRLTIEGRPAVRLVDAPADWKGWSRLPTVSLSGG